MAEPASRALSGSVVAVIGGSGGLGATLARSLVARGAQIVLAGRSLQRLAAVGIDEAELVALDIRDSTAGDGLVSAAMSRWGRLDGVINAAGIVAFGNLADTDDVAIEELFLTNVLGPLWMIRRLVEPLSTTRGFIVNISAVVAETPLPGMAAYGASKAALTAADSALTRELRRSGIHVCDARPPHTETGLATRPIAGVAPKLPVGLAPEVVAERIILGIEGNEAEIPASAFT
jgi:NAD(P)-dependent dehydrogenase (short-subunit alcohol dehydrogenase family)